MIEEALRLELKAVLTSTFVLDLRRVSSLVARIRSLFDLTLVTLFVTVLEILLGSVVVLGLLLMLCMSYLVLNL
jgi:hypothetical protein